MDTGAPFTDVVEINRTPPTTSNARERPPEIGFWGGATIVPQPLGSPEAVGHDLTKPSRHRPAVQSVIPKYMTTRAA